MPDGAPVIIASGFDKSACSPDLTSLYATFFASYHYDRTTVRTLPVGRRGKLHYWKYPDRKYRYWKFTLSKILIENA